MKIGSNGWRSKPEEMKSLAFDVYIYSNGKGGRVICRQTKNDLKFNDYKNEKIEIIAFIDAEYERKFKKVKEIKTW